MRPGFDDWMLDMAEAVAQRSRDPSTKCGTVITRPDKSVCSVGYNGFPRGMEDRDEWYTDRAEKYDRVIHGEMNALLSAKESVVGMTAYVTGPCCKDCAKHLAAAGIARVVWREPSEEFKARWAESCDRARQIMLDSGMEVVEILRPREGESSAVAKARQVHVGMYGTLYICQLYNGGLCLKRRTFASVEVEWGDLFEVTTEEAREIVQAGLANWHRSVPESKR